MATNPDRLTGDVSPAETADWRRQQQAWLAELNRIDATALTATDRAIYINLRDRIETDLALEACHREFWPLNNFGGWHLNLENSLAIAQETSGPDAERLEDWAGQIAARLSADTAALETGLEHGYSVPRPVAMIVADQYDGLAAPDSPVGALPDGSDPALAAHWSDLFDTVIAPAFTRQATYIRDRYAPRARTDLSLSALPDGPACLAASVRRNVGIVMTPGELPDFLPVVLEFASTQPPAQAREFLGETAHLVRAIFSALLARRSPYASVLAAVLDLAGEKAEPVALPDEPDLDEAWAEPEAFAGCSTAGQQRPDAARPVHVTRHKSSVPTEGVQA